MIDQLSNQYVFGLALFLGTLLGTLITTATATLRDLHYKRLYEQSLSDRLKSERQICEWIEHEIRRVRELNESLRESPFSNFNLN
jgi:hypothetical protein